jgi:dethiobiotin synthetase
LPVRIVVVGTGTEVGKTHVTMCLLAHARGRGRRIVGYKPIATGVDERCDDADQHAAALGVEPLPPTFAYRRPVSPHLAAREEGRPIDLDVIGRRADELASTADGVIVEAAGGLFSPIADTLTNVELVQRLLPAAVVLVAPDRLGVLHDLGACLAAARARGTAVSAIVLSAPAAPDASTGTNAAEVERIGLGPVVAVFPHAAFDDRRSLEAAARLWEASMASGALPPRCVRPFSPSHG